MKDMINQDIQIGDTVVVPHQSYQFILIAEVIGFTPKKVKILHLDERLIDPERILVINAVKKENPEYFL